MKRNYIYSYFPWAWSIRDIKRNIKYIINHDKTEELYFLPDENNNHINDKSLRAVQDKEILSRCLKEWLRYYPNHADINSNNRPLDNDTKQLLRTLGYLQ